MFHPKSRALANLLSASNRCLSNRTHQILLLFESSRRPLASQSLRFFASGPEKTIQKYPIPVYQPGTKSVVTHQPGEISNKSPKSYPLKMIGNTNCFEIGSIKFTFSINEFVSDKTKIMNIGECDVKNENKHICNIWISIPAAQILLEKVEEVSKSIDNHGVESFAKKRWLIRFIDEERNYLIELKLVNRGRVYHIDHFGTKLYLQVHQSHIDTAKSSSIFIPLNGITTFQEKLSNILRQYKKWNDPNYISTIKDLCIRSFFFVPKRYFLNLKKATGSGKCFKVGEIFVQIGEFNNETSKKRDVYVPIAAAQTLLGLLEDGYKTIQRYEGFLPSGMQPLNILYEKSFMYKDHEYTVRVEVPKTQFRHLWDTILMIWRRNLGNDNQTNVMIGGKGAHLLLQHYEEILREYEHLMSTLAETDSPKSSSIEEPRKRSSHIELAILKIEDESKVSDLKVLKSDKEGRRNLISMLDRSLPRSRSQ